MGIITKAIGFIVFALGILLLKYFPDIGYQRRAMISAATLISIVMIIFGLLALVFG